MTKILALLLSSQLPLIQAWAPIDTLSYAQLPKTLEFAEKAWSFPKPQDVNGPQVFLGDSVEGRSLPWTYRQEDSYFFDGYSGEVNEWPSRRAFLRQKTRSALKKATPKLEAMETTDYYYDDMGNLVPWNIPSKEDHHYFDGIGSSHVWSSAAPIIALHKEETPQQDEEALETADLYYDDMGSLVHWSVPQKKDEHHYFESIGASLVWSKEQVSSTIQEPTTPPKEDLETSAHYYDDLGNLVGWSIPNQGKHHYFEGIGASRAWSSVVSATKDLMLSRNKPEETLSDLGLEDCEHSYYSDTGDQLCWVGQ